MSLLDEKGRPGVTERALIVPPGSQLGPLAERGAGAARRGVAARGFYEKAVDRESAYEKLKGRAEARRRRNGAVAARRAGAAREPPPQPEQRSDGGSLASDILFGRRGPRGGRQSQGLIEAMANSAARSVGLASRPLADPRRARLAARRAALEDRTDVVSRLVRCLDHAANNELPAFSCVFPAQRNRALTVDEPGKCTAASAIDNECN